MLKLGILKEVPPKRKGYIKVALNEGVDAHLGEYFGDFVFDICAGKPYKEN